MVELKIAHQSQFHLIFIQGHVSYKKMCTFLTHFFMQQIFVEMSIVDSALVADSVMKVEKLRSVAAKINYIFTFK